MATKAPRWTSKFNHFPKDFLNGYRLATDTLSSEEIKKHIKFFTCKTLRHLAIGMSEFAGTDNANLRRLSKNLEGTMAYMATFLEVLQEVGDVTKFLDSTGKVDNPQKNMKKLIKVVTKIDSKILKQYGHIGVFMYLVSIYLLVHIRGYEIPQEGSGNEQEGNEGIKEVGERKRGVNSWIVLVKIHSKKKGGGSDLDISSDSNDEENSSSSSAESSVSPSIQSSDDEEITVRKVKPSKKQKKGKKSQVQSSDEDLLFDVPDTVDVHFDTESALPSTEEAKPKKKKKRKIDT